MKKSISLVLALLCASWMMSASPARPGKFTKVLPDGRKVTLELHGDEFRHYLTDESGRVVRIDKDGNVVPSSMAEVPVHMGGGDEVNRIRVQQLEKTKRLMRRSAPTRSAVGTIRFPLILVQFPDLAFTVGADSAAVNAAFNNMANLNGYSAHGATGSIHDYYDDNSLGQLDIQFDVFGPVTVSESYTYYGTDLYCEETGHSDEPVAQALIEAVRHIASLPGNEHVFDPYDHDGDGRVDALLLYYAGHNEAEHAPSNTIYPHQWNLSSWDYYHKTTYHNEQFGNVKFYSYSCTSELKGSDGTDMCGIGTACHEFGHALGLPDFYDTNYDNYGDGKCGALFNYSLMSSGNYNNDGRTPPYFTMEERIMMGWVEGDGYTAMPASGTITLPSVDNNFAYKEDTGVSGEYFAFECRSGQGWDTYVNPGLIVYHVDKSDNPVTIWRSSGSGTQTTAGGVWSSYRQYINTNIEHPCYFIVPAVDRDDLSGSHSKSGLPFPGSSGVTTYQWQGWDADNVQADEFTGISFNQTAGTVTLHRAGVETGLSGLVLDSAGNPVAGATVSVYSNYTLPTASSPSSAPRRGGIAKVARRMGTPLRTTTSASDGFYSFTLEDLDLSDIVVEVTASGYLVKTAPVALVDRAVVSQDITLMAVGEPTVSTLKKYNSLSEGTLYLLGFGEAGTALGAISYTADELAAYAGCKVVGLQFMYYQGDGTISGVQGVVDFGSERHVFDVPSAVPESWNYLDLSDADLRIPEGEKCYFGYALTECTQEYPFVYSDEDEVEGGMELFLTSSATVPQNVTWWSQSAPPLLISVMLEDPATLNYNYIANPQAGDYHVGDVLNLSLIQVSGDRAPDSAVSWYYDDEPVSGSVTLSRAGTHLLEARFTTRSGKRKVVELSLTVQ